MWMWKRCPHNGIELAAIGQELAAILWGGSIGPKNPNTRWLSYLNCKAASFRSESVSNFHITKKSPACPKGSYLLRGGDRRF
ncbi:unnamed protein product [Pieris macdunnoughi]|uniref:Uncharacterized protein n=1 Tax=Pieris macdunnoughi TaxID=345717 RepID=A0A821LND5_9NEOP|nr:unnamed protein product [Pieris macdunnoughi]